MAEIDEVFGAETSIEDDDDMQSVLASIAGEGDAAVSMKVYRMRGGKREWLFDALPSEAETMQETLRDSYGGGDFEVMIRKGNRIAKRKQLFIAAPLKRETPAQKSEASEMASVMMQGFNGLAQGIAELGKLMVTQQQAAPATISAQDQLQQTLNLMVTMKSVFDTGTKQDPMEQFLKGINFAKEIAIENDPDNDPSPGKVLMGLADKLAPVLGQIVSTPKMPDIPRQRLAPASGGPIAMAPKPGAQPTPQPTQQTQPKENDMNFMVKNAIKNQLSQLVNFAEADRDPYIYSTVVLDSVPDAFFEQFAGFMGAPDAVDQLAALDPRVNENRAWFVSLHENIVQQLTEGTDPDNIGDITTDETGTNANNGAINGDSERVSGDAGNP